jgi:hypothetical protein
MQKAVHDVLESLREFIVSHQYQDTPILTLYANVDSTDPDNRRDRPKWMIELKNEAKRLEQEYGTEALKRRDVKQRWSDAEEKIMAHLQHTKPQGRSIVLFTDLEDYVTLDLPVPMPTKLYYSGK